MRYKVVLCQCIFFSSYSLCSTIVFCAKLFFEAIYAIDMRWGNPVFGRERYAEPCIEGKPKRVCVACRETLAPTRLFQSESRPLQVGTFVFRLTAEDHELYQLVGIFASGLERRRTLPMLST